MYNKVINNLDILELNGIKEKLSKEIDNFNKGDKSLLEELNILLEQEIDYREKHKAENNIKTAHFPFRKTIDEFDFEYQPTINKKVIKDLMTLRFIEEKKNVIFVGTSGVGKTHLATSLGIEAAKKRNSVYFISCNDLINNLLTAYKENKVENRIKHYLKYKLLIIDEIGYLPIDKTGSNLFFQLISKRYENKSTIITTNQSFEKWSEVFGDATVANAILDRLLHHSEIINIKGESYRTKQIREKMNEV